MVLVVFTYFIGIKNYTLYTNCIIYRNFCIISTPTMYIIYIIKVYNNSAVETEFSVSYCIYKLPE